MIQYSTRVSLFLFLLLGAPEAFSQTFDTSVGDAMISKYFAAETDKLTDRVLGKIESLEDWQRQKVELRKQLFEMLGLDPVPAKTDLDVTITGSAEHDEFTVKKIHYQSMPGLYVTGNLYVPKETAGRLPAILYVCGHGRVEKDGVSYGNKVHYHHHGSWFARNGYVCLTIDTLQLGEIEGIHHGTHRENMWWWLNRGYTPAGVEAWNCIRALDYLQTLEQVDPERLGVTGRSGGGAYSWWIGAIDERVKCAVPVAGITDLQNHVVEGVVEGHCDCMFMVNTHRWDYPVVAALLAPRPLLISNTDRDSIFPLDGVYRAFKKVRRIYELHDASENIALHVTAGPHKDTQELRVHAFRWLNHHLKEDDSLITTAADKFFQPEDLKVFSKLPNDQINTEVHETFVPVANPRLPKDAEDWGRMTDKWLTELKLKSFAAWPADESAPSAQMVFSHTANGVAIQGFDFSPQPYITLRLFALRRIASAETRSVELRPLGESHWDAFAASVNAAFDGQLLLPVVGKQSDSEPEPKPLPLPDGDSAIVWVAPRGIGPTAWNQSERKQTQIRRRFYLLGQTLDGMRIYDIRRTAQAIRSIPYFRDSKVSVRSDGQMAGISLYASLFEPAISGLHLSGLPASHRDGPYLLNVRRIFDLPQSLAVAAGRVPVVVNSAEQGAWDYTTEALDRIGRSISIEP